MSMRGWVFGVCAFLAAVPAQSEEIYAKVDRWDITVEPPSHRCLMQRSYGSKDGKKSETLTVVYAADKEGVLLFWSNNWMTYLPADGDLDLGLVFKKGSSADQSWGSRSLHYRKINNTYMFTLAFTKAEEARRVLHDMASNEGFGLSLGPVLMTSLPLDASNAVEKLRECSLNGGRAQ
jgi:hypothetical protein